VLDAHGVGQGVGVGANSAHTLHKDQSLDKIAFLCQFFDAAMVVTDKDLCVADGFTVHGQTGVNGLFQCGMIRADWNRITHRNLPINGVLITFFVKMKIKTAAVDLQGRGCWGKTRKLFQLGRAKEKICKK